MYNNTNSILSQKDLKQMFWPQENVLCKMNALKYFQKFLINYAKCAKNIRKNFFMWCFSTNHSTVLSSPFIRMFHINVLKIYLKLTELMIISTINLRSLSAEMQEI